MTRNAFVALTASLVVAASTMAVAQTGPAPTPLAAGQPTTVAPATVKPNPDDKMICKTEMPIGSRLGGKPVCMKKSDWATQSRTAADQLLFRPPAGLKSP